MSDVVADQVVSVKSSDRAIENRRERTKASDSKATVKKADAKKNATTKTPTTKTATKKTGTKHTTAKKTPVKKAVVAKTTVPSNVSRNVALKTARKVAPEAAREAASKTDGLSQTKHAANTQVIASNSVSITGEVTGLFDGYLQGWAFDANNPDLCLAIEVWFDGVYGQLARADEFVMHTRQAPLAAQMHGFTVELKPHWLANAKRVSARVANQGPWLSGSIEMTDAGPVLVGLQAGSVANKVDGALDATVTGSNLKVWNESANRVYYAGGLKLVGWCMKDVVTDEPKTVRVLEGEKLIARARADQYVGFLSNRLQQGQGFEIDLPWAMADGKRHELEVLDEDGEPIKGSPLEVCISQTSQASIVLDAFKAAGLTTCLSDVTDVTDVAQERDAKDGVDVEDVADVADVEGQQDSLSPLLQLIQTHERIYPPSFGFVHYPFWYSLYQKPAPYQATQARVAVLVIASDTDTDADANTNGDTNTDANAGVARATVSIDSAFAQRLDAEQVQCLQVTPAGILKGLEEAANCADLVVPLWAGDLLSPHAVDMMVQALTHEADESDDEAVLSGWGYCDCDSVSSIGQTDVETMQRSDPWLKPDWDETLFYGLDYVSQGVFLSSAVVKDVLLTFAAQIQVLIDRNEPDSVWQAFLACVVEKYGQAQQATNRLALKQHATNPQATNQQPINQPNNLANGSLNGVCGVPTAPVHLKQVLYHRAQSNTQYLVNAQARYGALAWLADQRCPGATLLPVLAREPGIDDSLGSDGGLGSVVSVGSVGSVGSVLPTNPTIGWRVVWPMPQQAVSANSVPQEHSAPLVSVIVPTRNGVDLLQTVIDGLLNNTNYPAFEILVVDNDSDCPQTLAYLDILASLEGEGVQNAGIQTEGAQTAGLQADVVRTQGSLASPTLRVLRYPHPFNYAAINNFAARQASGELLLLLNNDIEITDARWLSEMVVQFQRGDEIGVVGKKLLWPNGMVQHGGVVVGINGLAAHAFNNCQTDDPGYMGLNRFDREQSAVTAACLMIKKDDYWAVGGLDAHQLPVAFNDVDLCLKVRQLGKKVVLTTRFPLIHHESATRGKEDTPQKLARAKRERDYFMRSWMPVDRVWTDPYYHPGLNHDFVSGPYGGLGRIGQA